jgi:hypothetical protein
MFIPDIAKRLGVDKSTISRDLAFRYDEYAEEIESTRKEYLLRRIADTEYLRQQALRGWRRSLKNAESRTVNMAKEGGVWKKRQKKDDKGQSGDSKFIAIATVLGRELDRLHGLLEECRQIGSSKAMHALQAEAMIEASIGSMVNRLSRHRLEHDSASEGTDDGGNIDAGT